MWPKNRRRQQRATGRCFKGQERLIKNLPDLLEPATRRRIEEWFHQQWPDVSIARAWRAEGGFSNETWFIELASGGDARVVVLRRQPLIGPLEPYDLAREARVIECLADSQVPVPTIEAFCDDRQVAGSPFLVMECVEGIVPEYRNLPEYPPWQDPLNRTEMARELLRALREIQSVPVGAGAPLATALNGAGVGAVPVISRVRSIREKLQAQVAPTSMPPVLEYAAAWLLENALPVEGGLVLVHGDFKVGNFIWRDDAIVSVLDWELAAIGDPLEDLGYACHPVMRARAPELMAMLVPFEELKILYEEEFGRELDLQRLHYYLISALYFHLYTFVTGLISGLKGADLRVALGFAKFPLGTKALIHHIERYEDGIHVL